MTINHYPRHSELKPRITVFGGGAGERVNNMIGRV